MPPRMTVRASAREAAPSPLVTRASCGPRGAFDSTYRSAVKVGVNARPENGTREAFANVRGPDLPHALDLGGILPHAISNMRCADEHVFHADLGRDEVLEESSPEEGSQARDRDLARSETAAGISVNVPGRPVVKRTSWLGHVANSFSVVCWRDAILLGKRTKEPAVLDPPDDSVEGGLDENGIGRSVKRLPRAEGLAVARQRRLRNVK